MDAGEAAATARCLRLNIAAVSQTEWCHHWADVQHNNRPPMWSLFQKTWLIRTNRVTGSDVRLGTAALLCVCARAGMPEGVYLRVGVPVPSPLYPGSTLFSLTVCVSPFFTLMLSSGRGITTITTNTELPLIAAVLCCMQKHTTKRAQKLLKQKHRYAWMLRGLQRLLAAGF